MFVFFIIVLFLNIIFALLLYRSFAINKMNWLFLLYWLANILVAFLLFNNTVDWKFEGLSILLIYVDIFIVSYHAIASKQKETYFSSEFWGGRTHFVSIGLVLCFFAGIGYTVMELVNNGFSITNLFSVSGLMESGYYFTDGRYGGSTRIQVSTIEQIFLTVNYSGFILAGYSFNLKLAKKRYCFIQFIPMILSMLATTAKTTFISGIILWMCGYLVASNCIQEQTERKRIPIFRIGIVVVASLALFYFSFYIRYGAGNSEAIINRMVMYAFGHVPCYDDWYAKFPTNLCGYSHGQQTFMMLFGNTLPDSLAKVYISPRFVTAYSWTNVITLFAYVLMDYGYLGATLFFIAFGIIAGFSIVSLKRNGSAIAHGIVGLCYYIILYSFLVSPMRYLSIVGAFLLFCIYIFVLLRVKVGSDEKV